MPFLKSQIVYFLKYPRYIPKYTEQEVPNSKLLSLGQIFHKWG